MNTTATTPAYTYTKAVYDIIREFPHQTTEFYAKKFDIDVKKVGQYIFRLKAAGFVESCLLKGHGPAHIYAVVKPYNVHLFREMERRRVSDSKQTRLLKEVVKLKTQKRKIGSLGIKRAAKRAAYQQSLLNTEVVPNTEFKNTPHVNAPVMVKAVQQNVPVQAPAPVKPKDVLEHVSSLTLAELRQLYEQLHKIFNVK